MIEEEEILCGGPHDGDTIMVDGTVDVVCFPEEDSNVVHVYMREEYCGFVYKGPDELILVKRAKGN